MFNFRTSSNESIEEWLNNLYLGTWDDPSWAAAAFLDDLETEVSDTRRKAGYERLKEMLVVVEMPLWNGRTAVSLEQRCENGDRFIASQWVAHSVIPTVFGV